MVYKYLFIQDGGTSVLQKLKRQKYNFFAFIPAIRVSSAQQRLRCCKKCPICHW